MERLENEMPYISIIIPVYNVEQYIEKCINSVIRQTLKNMEIIIVNDGTKDNSIERIRTIIENDQRIKLINKSNGGLMSAWIEGVKNARAEYIGFVDSDDWVDEDFFEQLYIEIKKSDADIVCGRYATEKENETEIIPRELLKCYTGKSDIEELIKRYFRTVFSSKNYISYCRWDKLYRKKLILDNIRFFDPRVSLGEDVNTNCAILPDCNKVVVMGNNSFYHYRNNNVSIVNTYNRKQIDNIQILYEALSLIAKTKKIDVKPIDEFVGDMVYNEILKVYRYNSNRQERKDILNKINSWEPSKNVLLECMQWKRITSRLFIMCFIYKKYFLCNMFFAIKKAMTCN